MDKGFFEFEFDEKSKKKINKTAHGWFCFLFLFVSLFVCFSL